MRILIQLPPGNADQPTIVIILPDLAVKSVSLRAIIFLDLFRPVTIVFILPGLTRSSFVIFVTVYFKERNYRTAVYR